MIRCLFTPLSRAVPAAILALALAGAGASADPAEQDLDAVDEGRSENVDEADTGTSRNVDDADTGASEDVDAVSTGRSRTPSDDPEASENLDAADVGETETTEEVDRRATWVPPACDDLRVALGDAPEGPDGEAWSRTLGGARTRLEQAKGGLADADAAYSTMMSRGYPTGAARAEIIDQRDAARSAYAEARCALPALVERARRSGAPADVWRAYL